MAKNAQHWEKTKGLLIVTLVIWAIFSMGIFLFGAELNSVSFTNPAHIHAPQTEETYHGRHTSRQ